MAYQVTRVSVTPGVSSLPMRALLLLFALLAACGQPSVFSIKTVTPDQFVAALGDVLTVEGEGLERVQSAKLRQGSASVELKIISAGPNSVVFTVEPGLATGLWTIELASRDGEIAKIEAAVEAIDGELQIEVVDVGQGDASYIRAPGGATLVIDGGRARTQNGSDSIAPILASRSISPDYMLVTHLDADHLGGVVDFMRGPDNLPCTRDDRAPLLGLLDTALGQNTCNTQLCVEYYKLRDCNASKMAAGAGWKVPEPGWTLRLGPSTDVTVVAINGVLSDGRVIPTGSDNSNSIALLVQYGRFRYFTGGDLTGGQHDGCQVGADSADVETAVGQIVGGVDVLHVNHHGSCTSTNPSFVNSLEPTVALISVGENNPYGHPAPQVLERLDDVGATIYLTSPGITSLEKGPLTQLPPSAVRRHGHLRISTGDGASYSVEVLGAPTTKKTFESRLSP